MIWRCHTSVVAWLYLYMYVCMGFSRWLSGTELTCQCRRCKRHGFYPWVGKISWSRKWQPTPVLLPGKFHGQRSLVGYYPCCHKKSDMTEHTHTHTHTCVCVCVCILTFSLFITKNVYVIKHDLYVPYLDLSPWPVPTDTSNWYHLTCPPFWVS